MGVAAYNRGSNAIRQSISDEQAAKRPDMDYRLGLMNGKDKRDRLESRVAELENDLVRAKSCIARLRATLTVEREERISQINSLNARHKFWLEAAERYKRSWHKASALIRTCLTPEQVEDYRRDRDWQS